MRRNSAVDSARREGDTFDIAFERWARRRAVSYTALTTDNVDQAKDDAVELIGYLRQAYKRGKVAP